MARLRRRWRAVKWAGVLLSLVIVACWGTSLAREFLYNANEKRGGLALQLYDGCLVLGSNPIWAWSETEAGWHVAKPAWVDVRWKPSYDISPDRRFRLLSPLWIPFLLVVMPTAILFWRDGYRIWLWGAGAGFVLVGAAWVLSLSYEVRWHDRTTRVCLRRGAVRIESLPAGCSIDCRQPWHVDRLSYKPPLDWLPSYRRGYVLPSTINGMSVSWQTIFPTTIIIPVWPVPICCLAIILATTLRRRRYSDAQCQNCGYDLTGNTSGVCPECGLRGREDTRCPIVENVNPQKRVQSSGPKGQGTT